MAGFEVNIEHWTIERRMTKVTSVFFFRWSTFDIYPIHCLVTPLPCHLVTFLCPQLSIFRICRSKISCFSILFCLLCKKSEYKSAIHAIRFLRNISYYTHCVYHGCSYAIASLLRMNGQRLRQYSACRSATAQNIGYTQYPLFWNLSVWKGATEHSRCPLAVIQEKRKHNKRIKENE